MEPKDSADNKREQEPLPKKRQPNTKTDPLNMRWNSSLKDHNNRVVRGFARTSYTVWIVVMVLGLILAFIVGLFLV